MADSPISSIIISWSLKSFYFVNIFVNKYLPIRMQELVSLVFVNIHLFLPNIDYCSIMFVHFKHFSDIYIFSKAMYKER